MVNLLHHYETQSNRIFLLLEHVSGGQLVGHVESIRNRYSERRKSKAKKSELAGTTTNRIVIGGEDVPLGTGVVPTGTGTVPLGTGVVPTGTGVVPTGTGVVPTGTGVVPTGTGVVPQSLPLHPILDDRSPVATSDEEDIIARLKELDPPTSNPVITSLTSISSDSDEDRLTRLARIVKEDATMNKIQEEEEIEEERDRLSDLRKQLMESFTDDNESNRLHGDLHGDLHSDLHGDKEEYTNENVTIVQQDSERLQPEGEDEESEEFSELKKQLLAFVSTVDEIGGVVSNDDDKLGGVVNEGIVNDEEQTTSSSNISIENPDQQYSHSGSDNITSQDPTISIIPSTPTITIPKQPLALSEQPFETLTTIDKQTIRYNDCK